MGVFTAFRAGRRTVHAGVQCARTHATWLDESSAVPHSSHCACTPHPSFDCPPQPVHFHRRRRPARNAMIELLSKPEAWVSFLTLTAMEIVLGIDNIIFLTI